MFQHVVCPPLLFLVIRSTEPKRGPNKITFLILSCVDFVRLENWDLSTAVQVIRLGMASWVTFRHDILHSDPKGGTQSTGSRVARSPTTDHRPVSPMLEAKVPVSFKTW